MSMESWTPLTSCAAASARPSRCSGPWSAARKSSCQRCFPRTLAIGARAAGDLRQELDAPFGGAEVGQVQRAVRVEHADQRNPRKIVTFCDHLRADQEIQLAAGKARQDGRGLPRT